MLKGLGSRTKEEEAKTREDYLKLSPEERAKATEQALKKIEADLALASEEIKKLETLCEEGSSKEALAVAYVQSSVPFDYTALPSKVIPPETAIVTRYEPY